MRWFLACVLCLEANVYFLPLSAAQGEVLVGSKRPTSRPAALSDRDLPPLSLPSSSSQRARSDKRDHVYRSEPTTRPISSQSLKTEPLLPSGSQIFGDVRKLSPKSQPTRSVQKSQAEHELEDATILGRKRRDNAAASHFTIEIGQLHIIPRKNVSEQLMLAPGVLTTNHGGEGHAQETFMRGFAAREGQDIEFMVDGVPLNEVSNPHGHGYADLLFIPPEFVLSLDISEGPFHARQGDFAFAGSANYQLGVAERGARMSYGYGSWNTHRLFFLYAPPKEPAGTFAGFEFYHTDGFGSNRSAQRATALGRYIIDDGGGAGGLKLAITAYGYAARYDQAGVIRQDDFLQGKIGFFDTYDPNQGGESNRLLLTFDTSFGPVDARFQQVAFVGYRVLRMRVNFTGWMTDTPFEADGTPVNQQRGDGSEMRYRALMVGSRGQYTIASLWRKLPQKLAMGYALRFDQGESAQLRLRSITAIPYRQIFDYDFSVINLAGWLSTRLQLLSWLELRAGLRIDAFSFGVTDTNQPLSDREGKRISTQTSQAFGFAINPRLTLDISPWPRLHFLASYGQGTRSTEAAALSDNEAAPFARAHVMDLGVSLAHGRKPQGFSLNSQLSYSFTAVDKDLLFSEIEGRNIIIGSSTRHAVLLGLRMGYRAWFDALLNVGWTYATLDATGELLPYIPQLIVRIDTAITGQLFTWNIGGIPLLGKLGLGFTFVPGRPLPLKAFGDPMFLLSLGAELQLWHFTIGLEIRNLLGLQYRQSEFNYASNFLGPNAHPPKLPTRHFAAGEPFYMMVTLGISLEKMFQNIANRDVHPTAK